MATFPIRAWAENNWRDQTPDAARGKPINQMATNLALLRAAEKGWIDEIKMPWPKPQLSRPATASAECRDLLDTPGIDEPESKRRFRPAFTLPTIQ
jgi:hypothetical protein